MTVRGLLSVSLIKTPLNICLAESLHLPNPRKMVVADSSIDEGQRCQLVTIGRALA
jgi:hypothetical protein